jgi:hypothetical protein
MQNLQKLVDAAVDAYPDDIAKATESVLKAAKRKAWFADLVDELLRRAVMTLIHATRHERNKEIRKAHGDYSNAAEMTEGTRAAREKVGQIARGVMAYMIAGKTLGVMTGADLVATAGAESERASGHTFNAKLCRKLAKTVKGETMVKQKFSLAKLASLFESV